jgi:hypothetical protein
MQHIARWLVIVAKVMAVVFENRWSLRGWSGPARASAGEKSGRSGKGRIAIGESFPQCCDQSASIP